MRLIDGDALKIALDTFATIVGFGGVYDRGQVMECINAAETADQWISVKERLPEEHPSMFYKLYGTEKWSGAMWRTESDRVLVAIKFPDGTRTVDKGKLQDGMWRTGVSPVIPQEVTHWALWPEPPKEVKP